MLKWVVWLLVGVGITAFAVRSNVGTEPEDRRDLYLRQLENNDAVPQAIRADYAHRHLFYGVLGLGWLSAGIVLASRDLT